MIYTETEKKELDEVRRVFAEHLRQSPDYELLWSDKVGYVWLAIGLEPLYVDTGRRIESAEDLCRECLESHRNGHPISHRQRPRAGKRRSPGARRDPPALETLYGSTPAVRLSLRGDPPAKGLM